MGLKTKQGVTRGRSHNDALAVEVVSYTIDQPRYRTPRSSDQTAVSVALMQRPLSRGVSGVSKAQVSPRRHLAGHSFAPFTGTPHRSPGPTTRNLHTLETAGSGGSIFFVRPLQSSPFSQSGPNCSVPPHAPPGREKRMQYPGLSTILEGG